MRKQLIWALALCAVVIVWVAEGAFGQMQPVVTGGFAKTGPAGTIVLVNNSSLGDDELARIANSLTQRVGNVAVATRLSGNPCWQGEWCLSVTNELLGKNIDAVSASAVVGAEVTRAIIAQVVQW